jgi:hypothetical protein
MCAELLSARLLLPCHSHSNVTLALEARNVTGSELGEDGLGPTGGLGLDLLGSSGRVRAGNLLRPDRYSSETRAGGSGQSARDRNSARHSGAGAEGRGEGTRAQHARDGGHLAAFKRWEGGVWRWREREMRMMIQARLDCQPGLGWVPTLQARLEIRNPTFYPALCRRTNAGCSVALERGVVTTASVMACSGS